jgi:thioredoxin-related protein
MEPTFDEAKTRYTGITFKRFDAEAPENAAMVQKFSVSAYPTIVFLDGKGNVLYNAAGSLEGDSFFSLIDQYNK